MEKPTNMSSFIHKKRRYLEVVISYISQTQLHRFAYGLF